MNIIKKNSYNILLVVIFILTVFAIGCETVYVANENTPIQIKKEGAFVTKNELMELSEGNLVKYRNEYNKKIYYYLPSDYIIIEGNNIRLKMEDDK